MKYNLQKLGECEDLMEVAKWKEGFEKELREKLLVYNCQGSWSPRAQKLIKEMLGK